MARFLDDSRLYALPVDDASFKPLALVDRRQFIEFFSRHYTLEVFGSPSILALLGYEDYKNIEPVIVEHNCSVEEVAKIIIDDAMQHMVTGFLVTNDGRYVHCNNGERIRADW